MQRTGRTLRSIQFATKGFRQQQTRQPNGIWIFNIIFRLHQRLSTLTNGFCVTKAWPFYVDSATSKRLSPQLLALVHSHRAIHKQDLATLDVEYRRLLRMLVGPPAGTNWASPLAQDFTWVEQQITGAVGLRWIEPWSVTCVEAVWKFASYVATLPSERWTRRMLHWNIRGRRTRGRPAYTWGTALENIVFGKALTTGLWRLLSMVIGCGSKRILCFSRCTLVDRVKSCISFACALKGLPSGRQAFTWLALPCLALPCLALPCLALTWLDLEPSSVTLLLSQFRSVIFLVSDVNCQTYFFNVHGSGSCVRSVCHMDASIVCWWSRPRLP